MFAALKRLVLRVARVPPEPHPPFGSPGSIRVFRAGRNYWSYLLVLWGLRQMVAGFFLFLFLGLTGTWLAASRSALTSRPAAPPVPPPARARARPLSLADVERAAWWLHALELFGLGSFLVQLPLSLAAARLDYEMRWYIVTDRSLRIREGIFGVREMTLTFANVQNITIDQGPLQRLLGIANVVVRTAGGGGGASAHDGGRTIGSQLHVGTLRAVDDAKGVRDLVLDRLRHLRDAGLGDPDDHRATARQEAPARDESLERALSALRQAARDLAVDARALRDVPGQPSA
jgi:hypothetical protein